MDPKTEFLTKNNDALTKLSKIEAILKNNKTMIENRGNCNWAHVGDANRVISDLDDILAYLNLPSMNY